MMLAVAIAALVGVTGAGFNPFRGIAPHVLAGAHPCGWIYLAGPLLGALLAAAHGSPPSCPDRQAAARRIDALLPALRLPRGRAASGSSGATRNLIAPSV